MNLFFKLVFSILISFVFAEESPIPKSTRDSFHRCTCETHIFEGPTLSRKPYYDYKIKRFEEIDSNCNGDSIKSCIKACKEEYGKETHNLDLLQPARGHKPFGEYLCKKVGRRTSFENKQAGMNVNLNCFLVTNSETGSEVELTTTIATDLRTEYEFSCLHGKFQLGNKVHFTTLSPTTVTTTQAATQSYFTCCGN